MAPIEMIKTRTKTGKCNFNINTLNQTYITYSNRISYRKILKKVIIKNRRYLTFYKLCVKDS